MIKRSTGRCNKTAEYILFICTCSIFFWIIQLIKKKTRSIKYKMIQISIPESVFTNNNAIKLEIKKRN